MNRLICAMSMLSLLAAANTAAARAGTRAGDAGVIAPAAQRKDAAVPPGSRSASQPNPGAPPQESDRLQEVVVTAQRRSQLAQDIPAAITAISSRQLHDMGFQRATDVMAAIPSVQVQDVYGKFQPIFSIRGISQSAYSANQSSPVGVYVDGAYIGETFLQGLNAFDLKRVEVLKGPQGTLYGKNTTGGAINLISRTPTIDGGTHANLTVGYGNYQAVHLDGGAEGTLIPGVLAVRVAGFYDHDEGYERIVNLGKRAYTNPGWGVRGTMVFRPTQDFTSILRYTHGSVDQVPAMPHDLGSLPVGPGGSLVDFGGYNRAGLGYWDFQSDVPNQYVRISYDLVTMTNKLSLPGSEVVSVTSYHSAKKRLDMDITGGLADVAQNQYNNDTRDWSQELRVLSKGLKKVKLIGGLYYGYEYNAEDDQYYSYYGPQTGLLNYLELFYPPATAGYITDFYQQFGDLVVNQTLAHTSYAAFGQVQWNFARRWDLIVGLRYTQDRDAQKYYNVSRFASIGGPPLGSYIPGNITAGTPNPIDSAFSPQLTFYTDGPYTSASAPLLHVVNRRPTGKATLAYHPAEDVMVYATYSVGYRSGNFNPGGHYLVQTVNNGGYAKPESITDYEMGLKSEFLHHRLRLDMAGFWYDYKNQQFQDVEGIASVLVNAGASRLRGIEAEMTAALARGLTFSLSGLYLDAKYLRLTLQGHNLDGNTMISAPTWSGTAALNYSFPVSDRFIGDLHLDANARSREWYNAFDGKYGNGNIGQAAFALVNGRVALRSDSGYEVALWAKNLFDTRYTSYAINIQSAYGMDYLLPGAPRTFGMDISYQF